MVLLLLVGYYLFKLEAQGPANDCGIAQWSIVIASGKTDNAIVHYLLL